MRDSSKIMPRIDILLATYNGERFLQEQLDSILSQDYPDFRIIIHDDGSSDGTFALLEHMAHHHPDRITLLNDGVVLRSACQNFFHLLAKSTADLVTFADQDDVWLPGRLSRLEEALRSFSTGPAGAYSDLRVVDENLSTIASSAWAMQGTPAWIASSIPDLAPGNCVTGCAFMLNAIARENIMARIRDKAVMHDHFSALCIAVDGGTLVPVPEALVLYRQHSDNQIGAVRMRGPFERLLRLPKDLRNLSYIHAQAGQVGIDVSFLRFVFWAARTVYRRSREQARPIANL